MNKPKRRDAPDLSVVRELLGDIPGESIEDAAVRVAARLQAEIGLRRAVEEERAKARAAVDRVSLEARELEIARDQANAAAAAANKRRALLLCAVRASCKRLRLRVAKWRQCAEDVTAVADDYRGRLAWALFDHRAAEDRYQRAEDQRAAALAELDGERAKAERFKAAYDLNHQRADEEAAAARVLRAKLRRAVAAARRWRTEARLMPQSRACGYCQRERDQARAALADAESRYQRAEDRAAKAESALETLEGQATLAEERAHALELERDEGREAVAWYRHQHERDRQAVYRWRLHRERDRHAVRRLRSEREQAEQLAADLADRLRSYLPDPAPAPPPELGRLDPARLPALPAGWWWQRGVGGKWFVWDRPKHAAGMLEPWGVQWRAMAAAEDHEGGAVREFFTQIAAGEWLADRLRQLAAQPPAMVEIEAPPGFPAYPDPTPPASSPGDDLTLPPGLTWTPCCGCGGWMVTCDGPPGLLGRTEPSPKGWRWLRAHPGDATGWQYVTPSDARTARLELAASVRRAFVTETPDHCSNDHAYPSAFRALSQQACSGAGDQPCTGEQSSPEPAGPGRAAFASRAIAAGLSEGLLRAILAHCSAAQPARPIRASRQARGTGRFPRGRGGPGVERLSAGAVKGKVGVMVQVAKARPSPADRGSAVNQGERARLGNPECAAGALAGGPEPEAGGSSGWFGTTGEGERVEPGGALRVAVAVLGGVDLVWWLAVRLLYLCGLRSQDQATCAGGRAEGWIGIGWRPASVPGGALPEAWIGVVPVDATARDGWPMGWAWRTNPLEPPDWVDVPDSDDRAPFEPGSVGVLVSDTSGRAVLAAWATAWGDRWAAPGFDAARLVRLLRAEITDAELRAEERDDEDDLDEPAPELSADGLPELPEGYTWCAGELSATISDGSTVIAGATRRAFWWDYAWMPPGDESLDARAPSRAEALRTLAAHAWQKARRELVADERPPATCRTGQDPADNRAADLPALPSGYRWEALADGSAQVMTSAEIGRGSCVAELYPIGRGSCVAELYPINSSEGVAGWFWSVAAWPGHDGESGVSPTRQEAAGNVARVLRRATTGEG